MSSDSKRAWKEAARALRKHEAAGTMESFWGQLVRPRGKSQGEEISNGDEESEEASREEVA